MAMGIKSYFKIFKTAAVDSSNDKVFKMSAALAYYTVFSLAPILMIVIYLADIFFGKDAVQGSVYGQIKGFVGNDAALQIQDIIKNATISPSFGWASIVGVISLIFAATGVFTEIQDSINTIWRLKAKPTKGFGKFFLNRLLSFSMILSMGFLLLVALVINTVIDAFSNYLTNHLPGIAFYVIYIINILLTLSITTLLFSLIFRMLPDAKISWKDVAVGSITTAVLFMIGRFGIGFYLARTKIGNSYGAAGSIIIILTWVYYSSIILYFGAEFTRAYAKYTGKLIYPNQYSVWFDQVEIQSEGALTEQDKKDKPMVVDASEKEKLVPKENPH
jgi:membrane protein